jgi:hypothetical protein
MEGSPAFHSHEALYVDTCCTATFTTRVGDRNRVQQLLGSIFDLCFAMGPTVLHKLNGQPVWALSVQGHGPTKPLAAALDPEGRDSLTRDFVAYHKSFKPGLGIAMPRDYLVTIGIRK